MTDKDTTVDENKMFNCCICNVCGKINCDGRAHAWQKYGELVSREVEEPKRLVSIVEAFDAMRNGLEVLDPDGIHCLIEDGELLWRFRTICEHHTVPHEHIPLPWTIPAHTVSESMWKPLTMPFATVDGKPSAFGALMDGLRVRRAGWEALTCAIKDGSIRNDENRPMLSLQNSDILATDWEVVLPEVWE